MALHFKGKVWVFGDNLDVDFELSPFRMRDAGLIKPDELGKWCMTNVDPDFPKKVKKGDIMVVGTNMGCGHDHSQANIGIKQAGLSCVIAESFDRNFLGIRFLSALPIIEYPGINKLAKEGDELEVDLHAGSIKNITTGKSPSSFTPLPDFLLDILETNGIDAYTEKMMLQGKM
jgi:3-isopropylmalate/(R)-2-methylmalate dehydratase small subunit